MRLSFLRGLRMGGAVGLAIWICTAGQAQNLPTEPLPTPLTPWICTEPTIPNYTKCAGHPEVELLTYDFYTGCYDIQDGHSLNCQNTWIEYFSTEGVAPEMMDYWTGAHLHSRMEGNPVNNLGGLRLDFMDRPALATGEWETESRTHSGVVRIPEVSGVVRTFIYWVVPRGYVCVPDEVWERDPADRTCRSCMGTLLVEAHVEGLEALPSSEYYDTASDPKGHTAGQQYYGTPQMIRALTELAKQYREWYEKENGKLVKVSYNDLSLVYGGIYDIDENRRWDCHHSLHRVGNSVDVNTTDRPWMIKTKMDELAKQLNLSQCHKSGTKIHYELNPCNC
ncbi:MAG: hypothetical protein ACOYXN_09960 [Acidobacteriota bacterium]